MAKKKSLFKKLRKSENSVVAEPEAPVDAALLEEIAKPKIEEVLKPADSNKPKMPTIKYKWNETNVDIIADELDEEIMAASQVFGRGIGVKKFKLITDNYPNILQIYKQKGKTHVTELINNISGFDTKTTTKIVDNLDEFIEYLDKFLKIKPNLLDQPKKSSSASKSIDKKSTGESDQETQLKYNLSKYKGKTIVFTGFRPKEVIEELEKLGTKITESVSKKTDLVVANDPEEESNKISKAKDLEIEIISKDQFFKTISK